MLLTEYRLKEDESVSEMVFLSKIVENMRQYIEQMANDKNCRLEDLEEAVFICRRLTELNEKKRRTEGN